MSGLNRTAVPVTAIIKFLAVKGVSCNPKVNPSTAELIRSLQSVKGVVSFRDTTLSKSKGNVLIRALLGQLVLPDFPGFANKVHAMYHVAEKYPKSKLNSLTVVQEEIRTGLGPEDDFTVSVCTVDGQQLTYGTPSRPIPVMETVKPLLYALALKGIGRSEVHKVHECDSR